MVASMIGTLLLAKRFVGMETDTFKLRKLKWSSTATPIAFLKDFIVKIIKRIHPPDDGYGDRVSGQRDTGGGTVPFVEEAQRSIQTYGVAI